MAILHCTKALVMNIGENVKRLRQQHGLLQKQVAEALDVHPANYNRIEKGERQLTLDMLLKAAKLFGLSLDEIVYPKDQLQAEQDQLSLIARVKSIEDLDEADQEAVIRVIDAMTSKKKFKAFFETQLKK